MSNKIGDNLNQKFSVGREFFLSPTLNNIGTLNYHVGVGGL